MRVVLEFADRGSLAGAVVKWATWGPYSHVDFVLPSGRLLGAVPKGGVCEREWTPCRHSERVAVEAPEAVLEWALAQKGAPYDLLGALGLGLHQDWHSDGAWFCSEYTAKAFWLAGRPLVRPSTVRRLSPRDLMLCTDLAPAAPWARSA